MTEYRVIYAPEALDDLKDIIDYVTGEVTIVRTIYGRGSKKAFFGNAR